MAIRWRKQDKQKLSRAVGKFNRKLTLESRKNPDITLPERLNVKDVANTISERSDFNRIINSINRIFKKGSTDIVKSKYTGQYITRYEEKEMQLLESRINRQRKKIKEKYNLSYSNQKALNLLPVDLKRTYENANKRAENKGNPEGAWDYFNNRKYQYQRESSSSYYDDLSDRVLRSYKQCIENNIPLFSDKLISKLNEKKATGLKILAMIEQYPLADFDYIYGPDEQEAKAENLMEIFDKAL